MKVRDFIISNHLKHLKHFKQWVPGASARQEKLIFFFALILASLGTSAAHVRELNG